MTEVEKTIKEIHDGVFQEGIREGARLLAELLKASHLTIDEALQQIQEEHNGHKSNS